MRELVQEQEDRVEYWFSDKWTPRMSVVSFFLGSGVACAVVVGREPIVAAKVGFSSLVVGCFLYLFFVLKDIRKDMKEVSE